jgi:hypothetical protein
MVKILVFCGMLLFMASSVLAQVSVGVSPMLATRNTSIMGYTFDNRSLSYEAGVGIASKITARGYHLFGKEYITQLNIFDEKEKKDYPVNFKYGFSATRGEIGIPLLYKGFLFEPFFVDSYTRSSNKATGEKITYSNDIINHSQGLGIYYSQLLYKGNNLSAKGFYTPKDNMLEFQYNRFNSRASVGLGYSCRTYENIKVSGPSLNFLLTF